MRSLVLFLALAPALALAQPTTSDRPVTRIGQSEQTINSAPGYYQHHLPGEATIQVQVSGNVVNPGLYEVADELDLRQLLSLAGGPQVDIRDPQRDRRVELRLFRPGTGLIYGALLVDAASFPDRIPALRHDDSLIVEVVDKRRLGWQDAATALGTVGTIAFIISVLGG